MSSSKTVQQSSTTQTSTPTPTAEETQLNKEQLKEVQASQPGRMALAEGSLNLGNLLVRGKPLPGYLESLPNGISPEVTTGLVQESLRDIQPYFQQGGLLDSGVKASIMAKTAADIRRQAEQFNIQSIAQLLNLATGQGTATPLSYQSDLSNQLGTRLAGLRTVNTQGTANMTTSNPFFTGTNIMQGFGTGIGVWGALRPTKQGN